MGKGTCLCITGAVVGALASYIYTSQPSGDNHSGVATTAATVVCAVTGVGVFITGLCFIINA